jgi:hypothetical protein
MARDDGQKMKKVEWIEQKFQKGIDYYLNTPELRNPVCQIPVIGSAIDFMITTSAQQVQQKRFLQISQILSEEINLIDETKVNKSFLDSEEFHDILRKTFENSLRTRHIEKTKLNCQILIGSILLDNTAKSHTAEDFLVFVEELSPTDIKLASVIYEQQKVMPQRFDEEENTELKFIVRKGWHNIRSVCNLAETDFNIALYKLSRAGLIKEIVGMYLGYKGGLYLITPAFKGLMDFISYTNEPLFTYKIQ